AMGRPIWPSPIKAICVIDGSLKMGDSGRCTQVSQGVGITLWPWWNEKALYPVTVGLFQRCGAPCGGLVLVNQQGAYALLQVTLYPTLQGYDVLLAKHVGQGQKPYPLQQRKRQSG